jgi:hypothetical protein
MFGRGLHPSLHSISEGNNVAKGIANAPTVEMFTKRSEVGWAKTFVSELVQGEPMIIPKEGQTESGRSTIYAAAKVQGLKVQTLTYNKKLWAVMLGKEASSDDVSAALV